MLEENKRIVILLIRSILIMGSVVLCCWLHKKAEDTRREADEIWEAREIFDAQRLELDARNAKEKTVGGRGDSSEMTLEDFKKWVQKHNLTTNVYLIKRKGR